MHPLLLLTLAASVQETPSPDVNAEVAAPVADEQWGQWRGPRMTGWSPSATPPLEWSEGHNVRWRSPVPGLGHSSPVIWGERVYLTSAVPFGDAFEPAPDLSPGAHDNAPITHAYRFVALAFDRASGELLWERSLRTEIPHERYHSSASLASASPVTDGEHVYAFFGSRGLYALDPAGELIWSRDLGTMQVKHGHGEGASPALHGDTLVVNWDHEGASRLLALDKRSGETRWEVAREEVTSWSSPIVVETSDGPQVVVNGTTRVRGHALEDGELLWECGGLSHNVVASPVSLGGMLFAGSSYEKQAMLALRLEGARGALEDTPHVAWFKRRRAPYVPSLLLTEVGLYYLQHYQGILSSVEPLTGSEASRPLRLPGIGDVYASPVAAAGRLYISDLSGSTLVLSDELPPRALALNRLPERFHASAALAGAELFLRGEHSLYCIAEDGLEPATSTPTSGG